VFLFNPPSPGGSQQNARNAYVGNHPRNPATASLLVFFVKRALYEKCPPFIEAQVPRVLPNGSLLDLICLVNTCKIIWCSNKNCMSRQDIHIKPSGPWVRGVESWHAALQGLQTSPAGHLTRCWLVAEAPLDICPRMICFPSEQHTFIVLLSFTKLLSLLLVSLSPFTHGLIHWIHWSALY